MSSAAPSHPQFGQEPRPAKPLVAAQSRNRRISNLNTLLHTTAAAPRVGAPEHQGLIPQPGIYRALRFCLASYSMSMLASSLLYELWLYTR